MAGGGTDKILVTDRTLTEFAGNVFRALGMAAEDASTVAETLVWANLRGTDSHGVVRIPRYLVLIADGDINPTPDIQITAETPASVTIDADRAPGAVAMTFAMEKAIAKARAAGIGWALVRATTHTAAIGRYALIAADAGMAGLVMTSSALANMAYHGAREKSVATNPLAIAVPAGSHAPLVLDMATSQVSAGGLRAAKEAGGEIKPGWALDADGRPTTVADLAESLQPLGGPKGAGLSVMIECLTSLLAGNPLTEASIADRPGGRRHKQNGLAVAVDIAAFTDVAAYRRNVDGLAAALKGLALADGTDEILAPGERGDRVFAVRSRSGIPIPGIVWRRLAETAQSLGVEMPETL